jgi:hypothetical protein
MKEMRTGYIKYYLRDVGLRGVNESEQEAFYLFVERYFDQLVNIGYLLKDVEFVDLSTEGKWRIVKSAEILWKSTKR